MRNYLIAPLLGAAMIAYACTPDGGGDGGGNNEDGGAMTVDAGVDGGTAHPDSSSSGDVHSSDSNPGTDSSSRRDGSSSGEVHSSDSNASGTDSSRNDSAGTGTDSSRPDTSTSTDTNTSHIDSSMGTSDSRVTSGDTGGSATDSSRADTNSSRIDSSSGTPDSGVSVPDSSSRVDSSSGTPDAGTGQGTAKVTLTKNQISYYNESVPRRPDLDGTHAYQGHDTVTVNGSFYGLTTIDWSDVPGCYDVRRTPPVATLTWPAPTVTPVRKYLKTIFVVEDPAAQSVTCGSSYTVKTTVQIGTSFTYDREPPVDMDGCWRDTGGTLHRLTMRHVTDYATTPSYYNPLYGEWIMGGLSDGGYQVDGFDFVVHNSDGSVRRSGSVTLDGETLTIGPSGFQSVLIRARSPSDHSIINGC